MPRSRQWYAALTVGLTAVLSLAALRYASHPWLLICGFGLAGCLTGMRIAAATGWRALLWTLAVVALTCGAAEGWAIRQSARERYRGREPRALWTPDNDLGYAPTPGFSGRAWRIQGDADSMVYDVKYSIGANGLRRSPPDRGPDISACVLFFGGSFTFGLGLEDEETMPYQVGRLSNGRVRVYNFGVNGYGPHQMLSALESGRVDAAINCRPTHVIYLAVWDHVARVAGLRPWQRHDPRYRLDPGGSARRDGNFDDDPSPEPRPWLLARVLRQFEKSVLIQRVSRRVRPITKEDVRLFLAIVSRSRELTFREYPGARFDVILWRAFISYFRQADARRVNEMMVTALRSAGYSLHDVDSILPGFATDPLPYEIPLEPHPNALATRLLAEYVLRAIVHAPDPGGAP